MGLSGQQEGSIEMTFGTPWALCLIVLVLAPLFISRFRRRIKFPNVRSFRNLKKKWRYCIPTVFVTLAGIAIVLATCDPQLGLVRQEKRPLCTSTALSIDLSGSMSSRIKPVKEGVYKFLGGMEANVEDNLVSLTVFSKDAYTVCPPTDDYVVLRQFIDSISVRTLGTTTAIGRGLLASASSVLGDRITYNQLEEHAENQTAPSEVKGKVIILFTDGSQNTGIRSEPVLKLMAAMGIRVYLIQARAYSSNVEQRLIEKTGGKYYELDNLENIGEVYQEISSLEKDRTTIITFEDRKRIYTYFVLAGLILFSGGIALRECLFLRI